MVTFMVLWNNFPFCLKTWLHKFIREGALADAPTQALAMIGELYFPFEYPKWVSRVWAPTNIHAAKNMVKSIWHPFHWHIFHDQLAFHVSYPTSKKILILWMTSSKTYCQITSLFFLEYLWVFQKHSSFSHPIQSFVMPLSALPPYLKWNVATICIEESSNWWERSSSFRRLAQKDFHL